MTVLWLLAAAAVLAIAVHAVLELRFVIPRRLAVLDRGLPGQGDFDLLVLSFDGPPEPLVAALETVRHRIRRLIVARVMPDDGGNARERLAEDDLRVDRSILGFPNAELVLFFGVPAEVIAEYARGEGLHAVVIDRSLPEIAARLEGSDVVVLSITEAQGIATSPRLRARNCARHTRLRWTPPVRPSAASSR